MAEYNGVTLEPLMDGSQDRDYQVEQFIFWGAGRAAALALSPKFSSVALCANATYMVTRIAHLYEVELQSGAVVGLVGGLSTAVGTAAISLLIPLKAVRVPVAVGLTYAIGKIAHIWIQDGMPSDIERYKPMVAEFLESGKAIASDIIPFTQGQRDVWAGIANETGLAKETLKQVYEEKVTPAIDKWHTETKFQIHDSAAEVMAKVTDAAKDKIDAAKENIDVAKELAKGGVEVAKASAQVAVETAKTKALNTVNTAKDKIGGLRK